MGKELTLYSFSELRGFSVKLNWQAPRVAFGRKADRVNQRITNTCAKFAHLY